MRRFSAEIVILHPRYLPRIAEALADVDLELTVNHEAIDLYGPAQFATVIGNSTLEEGAIGDWLLEIIRPCGADLYEWGYDDVAACRRRARSGW
jgi:hypothetical protein